MPELQIQTTADGSSTLFLPELNETYHSASGAWGETQHVFIQNGLQAFWARSNTKHARILEFGLGTGLNALASFAAAQRVGGTLNYVGLEKHPVPAALLASLTIPDLPSELTQLWNSLNQHLWNEPLNLGKTGTFLKRSGDVHEMVFEASSVDVVFYDFFAPKKVPDLWNFEILKRVCATLKPGGLFVTYAATGQLKRDLESLGMTVERLKGFAQKREMMRAWG